MKKIRRIAVILSMAFMAQLFTVPQIAYAQAQNTQAAEETQNTGTAAEVSNDDLTTDNFRVRAVPGLDGYYKSGVPVPITIYLESLNEDFEGVVRVIVPSGEYGLDASAYEKDVMLTAGAEKVITMSVDNTYGVSAYKLELENSAGKVVLEYDIKAKSQTNESALVGVLSDDFTALNYFDGKRLAFGSYTAMTQIVELKTDTFPDQASGLEALSYLIINSYDTSALSADQYHALKGWVENGGILILGTGADYKQTLSGFQDGFIGGDIGTARAGQLELQTGSDAVSFTESDGIVELSMTEGNTLDGVLSIPELIWTQECGQGHVVMTAYNLGMEPVSSWTSKGEMAESLLTLSATGYSQQRIENLNYGNSVDVWNMSSVVDGLYDVAAPNMPVLIILFVVFIIFAGPGLYLILKAADKREWMWGIVPALSIVVMAGVFLLSRDMRISSPQEASVTALCYDSQKEAASRKVYMGIRVPGASETKVTLRENLHSLQLLEDYSSYVWYSSYSGTSDSYAYKTAVRELAEGYLLTIRNGSTFESSYLSAEVASDSAESYGLEADVQKSISGIRGTVTNNTEYDLCGVSVYTNSRMVIIGSLKAGESVSFDESDNNYFSAGFVDFYSYNMPGMDDVKLQEQFANVWNLFCNEYLYSMESDHAYTFAYLPEWEADYMAEEEVGEVNAAMMVRCDTVPYGDYPGAESVTLFPYTVGTPENWDLDGWLSDREVEVSFDIGSELQSIYALVRAEDDASQWGSSKDVTVYGYNQQTGEYDELFTDGLVMEFSDGCPYMDENGVVKMKFTTPLTDGVDYAPEITAIGGGY